MVRDAGYHILRHPRIYTLTILARVLGLGTKGGSGWALSMGALGAFVLRIRWRDLEINFFFIFFSTSPHRRRKFSFPAFKYTKWDLLRN